MAPYQDWNQFCNEALRLWHIHNELAQPSQIERIGLRFINRLSLPEGAQISEFLRMPPQPPSTLNLPIANFVHHDTWDVVGYPYALSVAQTIQATASNDLAETFLILDIDVATNQPCAPTQETIESRLAEMRWLKNKAFYGSVTELALQTLDLR